MSGRPTVLFNGRTYFVADVKDDRVTLEEPGTGDQFVVSRGELPKFFENIGRGVSGVQDEPIPIRQDPSVPIRPADPKGRNE